MGRDPQIELRRSVGEWIMPWALIAILVVVWVISFVVLKVSSVLIHLLLLVAAAILIYRLVTGRRAV